MSYVYVIRSGVNGRRYIGSCQDIHRRLLEHNTGQNKSTRHGVPWSLVYTERFEKAACWEALEGQHFQCSLPRRRCSRGELHTIFHTIWGPVTISDFETFTADLAARQVVQ